MTEKFMALALGLEEHYHCLIHAAFEMDKAAKAYEDAALAEIEKIHGKDRGPAYVIGPERPGQSAAQAYARDASHKIIHQFMRDRGGLHPDVPFPYEGSKPLVERRESGVDPDNPAGFSPRLLAEWLDSKYSLEASALESEARNLLRPLAENTAAFGGRWGAKLESDDKGRTTITVGTTSLSSYLASFRAWLKWRGEDADSPVFREGTRVESRTKHAIGKGVGFTLFTEIAKFVLDPSATADLQVFLSTKGGQRA